MRFAVYRVRRFRRPIRAPELMRSPIEAPNAAEALRRYHETMPGIPLEDLRAEPIVTPAWPASGGAA